MEPRNKHTKDERKHKSITTAKAPTAKLRRAHNTGNDRKQEETKTAKRSKTNLYLR